MSYPEFFQTGMGRKFYEGDVPRIARALEEIGKQIKFTNELKEKEFEIKDTKDDKWDNQRNPNESKEYFIKLENGKELKVGSKNWFSDDPSGEISLNLPSALEFGNYFTYVNSFDNWDFGCYIAFLEVLNSDINDIVGYYLLDTKMEGCYLEKVEGKSEYNKKFLIYNKLHLK